MIIIKNYVCPFCFNTAMNCECNNSPDYLIKIDRKLQTAIKILNKKNFRTISCCSGHYSKNPKTLTMYIQFSIFPSTDSLPVGWKRDRNTIYFVKNVESKKEFLIEQNNKILSLNTWVKSL